VSRVHPKEFRADVVAVARRGDAPISQIAKDFGISDSCLRNWVHAAEVDTCDALGHRVRGADGDHEGIHAGCGDERRRQAAVLRHEAQGGPGTPAVDPEEHRYRPP